jgi:hypothetical protein
VPPPVDYLDDGTMDVGEFAYPFSNETGFGQSALWDAVRSGGIDAGAIVGVSGSVLDFAAVAGASCLQIVSVDINRATVRMVARLRDVLFQMATVREVFEVRRHWKTGALIARTRGSIASFLQVLLDSWRQSRQERLSDILARFEFVGSALPMLAALSSLESVCWGKLNFSQWYKADGLCQALSRLTCAGRFAIVCGDLQRQSTLNALRGALHHHNRISILNLSNALDYMKDKAGFWRVMEALPCTTNAKIITSAQAERLIPFLGTFAAPKVHLWRHFREWRDDEEFWAAMGTLY